MPVTATTAVPDVGQPTLDTSSLDEITASWVDSADYGEYHVQIRETGESAWDSSADGFAEQTTPHDGATEVTFTGLNSGEKYEIRVRQETEHSIGNWTTPVSGTTDLPAPSSVTTSSVSSTEVELTWQDNSNQEAGFKVFRSERHPDDGYLTFTEVKSVGENTTSTTDSTADPGRDYRYKIASYTEHAISKSGNTEASTIAEFPCGRGGVIYPLGDYREIYNAELDGRWVKFGDVHIDSDTDLTLVLEGQFDIHSIVRHITGDAVIEFDVWARQQNATADVRVENLAEESWYRMQFDGVLARTASGRAHGETTKYGDIEFNAVEVPYE